jgi:nicotinate-nucleotide adenylyltransferase
MLPTRLGVFGGSFDPVHLGHLLLAELCCESLRLDTVKFVVANVSPLKTGLQLASNRDRIEMLKLAIGGNPRFELDTREIDRGGVSYTIDTIRSIAVEAPGADLYFLMGADVLADLDRWREPREIFRLATPCVIARGGLGEPDWQRLAAYVDPSRLGDIKRSKVIVPQLEISSSEIKSRIRSGRSIRYQTPESVENYIRDQNLYQDEK